MSQWTENDNDESQVESSQSLVSRWRDGLQFDVGERDRHSDDDGRPVGATTFV